MLVATTLVEPGPDYNDTIEKIRRLTEEASQQGAGYICFPEYFLPAEPDEAGRMICGVSDDGFTVEKLVSFAAAYDIGIVIGVTERTANRRYPVFDFYNTALFIDKTGIRGRHRKVFLWVDSEAPGRDAEKEKSRVDPYDTNAHFYSDCGETCCYLPGWSFECISFGGLERAIGMICADGLIPATWSHVIPQSPQIVFYPNGRDNLLKRWGPDLGYIAKKYKIPIVASNVHVYSEAAIYDSDGRCVGRLEKSEGVAVAEVTVGKRQPYRPITIRHWDGDPLENLDRLDKF